MLSNITILVTAVRQGFLCRYAEMLGSARFSFVAQYSVFSDKEDSDVIFVLAAGLVTDWSHGFKIL